MSQSIYLTETTFKKPQNTTNLLTRKIQRACRMSLIEPDLSLNLDVADYINEKQGSAPHDAAVTIVKLINNRDSHTSIFALSLLDVLVKNCGYPFHLQISRKEFLNELVKRFPEKPQARYSRIQRLILTAIEEWYQTLCKHASYKDDMSYIRDMHRLLRYKGYVFPKINEEDLAVLKPSDHLKTPSEIQKEQGIAQAAKLEELIRRGKPEDLKEANKLMKVMAGFKEDNAIQSKQILMDELNKLKRKADLFNEILSVSEYSDMDKETSDELYGALKVSQPRFQKIIEEEHDDNTLVQDLLQFNDTVNQLLKKYQLLKSGQTGDAGLIHIAPISSNTLTDSGGALANEINLIDFEDDNVKPVTSNGLCNKDTVDNLLDDLGTLNFSQTSQDYGLGGSISLNTLKSTLPVATTRVDTFGLLNKYPVGSTLDSQSSHTNDVLSKNDHVDLLGDLSSNSSLLINQSTPASHRILVNQSVNLKLEFVITRESLSTIKITSFISNVGSLIISDLKLMIAVPKGLALRLDSQSNNFILPNTNDAIHQESWIDNAMKDSNKPLKIKWKTTYHIGGVPSEETAVFICPKI